MCDRFAEFEVSRRCNVRFLSISRYEATGRFQFAKLHSSFFRFGLERLDQVVEIDTHWGLQ